MTLIQPDAPKTARCFMRSWQLADGEGAEWERSSGLMHESQQSVHWCVYFDG